MKKSSPSPFYFFFFFQSFPQISSCENEFAIAKWKLCKTKEEKIKWHLKHTPWFNLQTIETLVKFEMDPDARYIQSLPKLAEIVEDEKKNEERSKEYYLTKYKEEEKTKC